ncbi:uncharacterized protein J3R85_018893 [Psidium guajava]|nr:uncharacterized protein J3R85_018893 [Psidium guajava]
MSSLSRRRKDFTSVVVPLLLRSKLKPSTLSVQRALDSGSVKGIIIVISGGRREKHRKETKVSVPLPAVPDHWPCFPACKPVCKSESQVPLAMLVVETAPLC